MSRALAVFHGQFGRATVYQLNRPFNIHAHREGHLIFQVGGTPGCIRRRRRDASGSTSDTVVAVNPWEPHNFLPTDIDDGALFLRPLRQRRMVRARRRRARALRFGRSRIARTPAIARHVRRAAAMVCGAPSLAGLDAELRQLIAACHEESWRQADGRSERARSRASPIFACASRSACMAERPAPISNSTPSRARRACRGRISTSCSARRPGVTPNLYLNTLLMEQALDTLVAQRGADRRDRLRSRLSPRRAASRAFFAGQCRHGADRLSARGQGV